MTSRLKKKLNDLGVDTASARANENFCLIGTPLPALEKTKDAGEFLPLWKQEVRDEKGRRRLHGAFTGGFSAGYFNSVGSAEGWTPSTFKSSRSDRSKGKQAQPEDFMDDEDLAELRDSRKLVDTNEQMDVDIWSTGGRKGVVGDEEDVSITRALEASLLPSTQDSVGAQILRKMGWRLGHGIGPRVTYEERMAQDSVYGEAPSNQLEDDEEAKKHLYPPRDTRVPHFKRKDDSHGLGYVGGLGLTELVSDDSSRRGAQPGGPNISAGFGLGALNDADDDDLDVYDGGVDKSRNGRRVAYEGDDDDSKIIMGSRKRSRAANNVNGLGPDFVKSTGKANESTGETRFFHDGSAVLPGFTASAKPVTDEKWYPLPQVPKGWIPNPKRIWENDKENLASIPSEKSGEGGHQSKMTSDERGKVLGETPLPAAPRSVFDYLKPTDRERLKALSTGRVNIPTPSPAVSKLDSQSPPPPLSPQSTIPRLDPQVAKMALLGFQPFANDPIKQARYSAFLEAQSEGSDAIPFGRLPNQKEEEFAKELSDYAKSATIFKPVSASMAGRFTSASVVEMGSKVVEGLHQPSKEPGYLSNKPDDDSTSKVEEKKEESPKDHAARLGMFGPLTREVKTWMPAKLLCKRFGVKEPVIEAKEDDLVPGTSTATGASSKGQREVLAITEGSVNQEAGIGEVKSEIGEGTARPSRPGRKDIANIGMGEDETQGRDILTYERPTMDIFKAIFASDDEDSDEEESTEKEKADAEKTLKIPNGGAEPAEAVLAPQASTSSTAATLDGTSKQSTLQAPVAGEVDLTAFKPTFVPRSERSKGKDKEEKNRSDKKEKAKKKEKKKGKSTLMSFDVEDGDGDSELRGRDKAGQEGEREKKRKKKRKEDKTGDVPPDDDEGMWVEKPAPTVVQGVNNASEALANAAPTEVDGSGEVAGPTRGRKRAIDFM